MTAIVVGVDGGGSSTRVFVTDEHGGELARVTGAGSALRPGAEHQSGEVIAILVRDALESAGVAETRPRAMCVGVAGAGREAARQALWQSLVGHQLADEVDVRTDAAVALEDAFGDGSGILLIAGTGSVAYGRGPGGAFERCGGWGPSFGDEGSGAWIGRKALSVITCAADGREPPNALTGAILTVAEVASLEELIPWAAAASPRDLASLVPAVAHAASQGDARANTVLGLATEELVLHVRSLARQLFTDERSAIPVALHGGLLGKRGPLRRRVEHRLKSAVPGAQIRAGEVQAARGAVRVALGMLGITTDALSGREAAGGGERSAVERRLSAISSQQSATRQLIADS